MTKLIEFYFDFSSPYSYVAYKEIIRLEKNNTFKINYMPILLGGLHNSAGITPAAFINLKKNYMIDDTNLICKKKNIKFIFNSYFPIKTVNFMRGVLIAEKDNSEKNYIEKIFNAIWRDGLNMNDHTIIEKVHKNMDINPETFFKKTSDQKIKDKLKNLTDSALKNVFLPIPVFKLFGFGGSRKK